MPDEETGATGTRLPFFEPVVPDKEFPATWNGGHALVVEFGDEWLTASCQCGAPVGEGNPTVSLDQFGQEWERHVMTRRAAS